MADDEAGLPAQHAWTWSILSRDIAASHIDACAWVVLVRLQCILTTKQLPQLIGLPVLIHLGDDVSRDTRLVHPAELRADVAPVLIQAYYSRTNSRISAVPLSSTLQNTMFSSPLHWSEPAPSNIGGHLWELSFIPTQVHSPNGISQSSPSHSLGPIA